MYSRTTSIYGVSEFRIKNNQLLISKHRFKKQEEKTKRKGVVLFKCEKQEKHQII